MCRNKELWHIRQTNIACFHSDVDSRPDKIVLSHDCKWGIVWGVVTPGWEEGN